MDQAAYTLAALVEVQRGGQFPSTPAELACLIGGSATASDVSRRMAVLERCGVIERVLDEHGELALTDMGNVIGYQLTNLGEQLLLEDIANWQPERSERARREAEMLRAAGGIL